MDNIKLTLEISDPDVLVELNKFESRTEATMYALGALRIGVLALRTVSGEVDATAIKDAGRQVLAEIKTELTVWANDTTRTIANELKNYFDPTSGQFHQRVRKLIALDGELETVMKSLIGNHEGSLLVSTINERLGSKSDLFKLLSPDSQTSVRTQIKELLEESLRAYKKAATDEFSLNIKDSSLSLFVAKVQEHMLAQTNQLDSSIKSAVGEFSLDKPDSALSRLVGKVENVLKAVNEQFSMDVPSSGLNRIMAALETQDRKNTEFRAEVREQLARIQAKKEAGDRTTLHGIEFEAQLGSLLDALAQRYGDVFEAVGNTTGAIKMCKKGDHVTTLGADCAAAGAKITWEAKESGGYTLKSALDEIEEARKNRQAQIGIFVFSGKVAPEGIEKLSRHGNNLVVVWDAENLSDSVTIGGVYSVARALCTRQRAADKESTEAVSTIDRAIRSVEKQATFLEEVLSSAVAINSHSDKIADRVRKMKDELRREITKLDAAVQQLSAHSE